MIIRLIKPRSCPTKRWSGGWTKQYYIYPEDASYAEGNYLFRISMAKAERKHSEYTYLPGVERYIVSLDGECDLEHDEKKKKRTVHLTPLGVVDKFAGDCHTEAHGAIRDFNLMLKDGTIGGMGVVDEGRIRLTGCFTHLAVFACDYVELYINPVKYCLSKYEMLLIEDPNSEIAPILTVNPKVVICKIHVKNNKRKRK